MKPKINRRAFIVSSSMGIAGAGIGISNIGKANAFAGNRGEPLKIKEYRVLGRTGFKVSDIGCGPAIMTEENMLKAVLDTGVNIIDTAEFYGEGRNEKLVGRAIPGYKRKSLFINTKLMIGQSDTAESIIERVRKCLERLNTSYLDGLMFWNPSSVKDLKNKNFHKAFAQLRKEGRVRYAGVSCHGTEYVNPATENMQQIICGAVDDGRFDLALFVYNYVQREMGENILKECAKKNVGAILMKTDPLGKGYTGFLSSVENAIKENKPLDENSRKRYDMVLEKQKSAKQFLEENQYYNTLSRREAAVRFVLNNPAVSSTLVTFRSYEEIPDYIGMSGSTLTTENISLINSLRQYCGHLYCRHACGICEKSCPEKVPVNTIMRYNHYFVAQSREKYAISKYYELTGNRADKCKDCNGYCESACPYGVAVHALLQAADENLSVKKS